MSMETLMAEYQRSAILTALSEVPGFELNGDILSSVLKMEAVKCSRDQLRTQLTWLEQQGYITIEKIGRNKVWKATITQAGVDVAEGNIFVPGIKRPGPS